MTTDFYSHGGYPATGAAGASAAMRSELDLVEAGFAKLAALTGNGSKFLRVNSGATAYEALDVPSAVTALFSAVISPTQITSNQNDYNPTSLSTATAVRISTDASRNITGLQGGTAGRLLLVANAGSFNAVLKAEDAGSSAANRFALSYDLTLLPGWMVLLWYDGTSSRWRAQGLQASAFIQTLLDDADAGAALTTLINGATEDTAPDKIADFLGSYDASAATGKKLRLITALARAMPFGQGPLINGKIVTSVAANALTVSVKGDNDSDPSSTNPVYALFRKSTLTDSGFDIVPITGALSVVVSSGSTLGHRSGAACSLFAYLINNAGTAELAVSSMPPDYAGTFADTRLVSTTAEGGAGAADSATGVYSTTARSNVPWVCVAMLYSTQATAGTWATAIAQVNQAPFDIPKYAFRVHRNGSNQTGVATGTFTKFAPTTESFDLGGAYDLSGDNRYECVVGGPHTFYFQQTPVNPIDAMYISAAIYVNGVLAAEGATRYGGTSSGDFAQVTTTVNLKTGDYVEAYIYHGRGTNEDFNGSDSYLYFDGWRH